MGGEEKLFFYKVCCEPRNGNPCVVKFKERNIAKGTVGYIFVLDEDALWCETIEEAMSSVTAVGKDLGLFRQYGICKVEIGNSFAVYSQIRKIEEISEKLKK